MRKKHFRHRPVTLTALLSALTLMLAGLWVASPAQADEQVDPGTNVTAVSNDCGEVTFTGASSDFPVTVFLDGESGESFPVLYEEPTTIQTEVSPLLYTAVAERTGNENLVEEGSVVVEPCEVGNEQGQNVSVVSNACGEATFTGVNSDSTITVTADGESFDVGYEKSVTIQTDSNPLTYTAVTQWTSEENWTEEGSIAVEPCEKPEVKAPTVAPPAGL